MTCLCQQEILDRLIFPMQHVRKTSPHAGQRPSDRCFSLSLKPQKFVPRSDAGAPRVIACACFGTLQYYVVCAGVEAIRLSSGFESLNVDVGHVPFAGHGLFWWLFLYADGGCMQFHRVGIIVHVLLVQVAESFLDGWPAEAARLLDVVNLQEQVQTMLEDALADIGPTLGLPLRDTICVRDYNRCPEGENRRVLDVCTFSKQLFVEGWLDKGDACSPPP